MSEIKQSNSIGRAFAVIGRILGWSTLGAICGLLLGFMVGVVHAPPVNPNDSLEHEWYTPFVLIVLMPIECLGGLLVGFVVAVTDIAPNRLKSFTFALGGAVLGIVVVWVLALASRVLVADERGGPMHVLSLVVQMAGAIAGLIFAASKQTAKGQSSSQDIA